MCANIENGGTSGGGSNGKSGCQSDTGYDGEVLETNKYKWW